MTGGHWRGGLWAEYQEQPDRDKSMAVSFDPMPRGNWRAIYLAGLAASVLLSVIVGAFLYRYAERLQGVYEHQAEQRAEHYRSRANTANERCARIVPAPEKASCVRQERDGARQGEREAYDLQAQLVTSAWTRSMGVAAIIGMTVGIVGVGLVLITFRETRKAAEAAREGNEIARDTAKRQLRAYLSITHLGIYGLKSRNRKVFFSMCLTNAGQSPAKRYRGTWGAYVADPDAPPRFPPRSSLLKEGADILGPGKDNVHIKRPMMTLTMKQAAAIKAGELCVFVTGIAVYTDIFGGRYEVLMAYRNYEILDHSQLQTVVFSERRLN